MTQPDPLNLKNLVTACEKIARDAGDILMHFYKHGVDVATKSDDTPVTDADRAADEFIYKALCNLDPTLPVISEERKIPPYSIRKGWQHYWLVDPMDGTREFIKRSGEFTVNIALIENGEAILGVVYAPVKNLLWQATSETRPFKTEADGTRREIHARSLDQSKTTVIIGHSATDDRHKNLLKNIDPKNIRTMGSSMKFCVLAEGAADIYPRLGKTSEWDTAAAQCILERAGGHITELNMQRLTYNTKASLLNPEFFAFGDNDNNWSRYHQEHD